MGRAPGGVGGRTELCEKRDTFYSRRLRTWKPLVYLQVALDIFGGILYMLLNSTGCFIKPK